jgi:ABC-2 type transport system ATP-binding protein
MSYMIETQGLTRKFRHVAAVRQLNLRIAEREVFGFLGPNGAGKTTTIRMLATLLTPTRGRAFIDGVDVVRRPRTARRLFGYMPDHIGIYDDMLVEEYLQFFAACYRIHGEKRMRVVEDVLELTELAGKRDSPVRTLSRGMSQRLGLARVLLHDPKVLLLDEPAAGLDPRARVEFKELIGELRSMGKTILISSHILGEIEEMCTSIGIIEAGELIYAGTIQEVRSRLIEETGREVRLRAGHPEGDGAPDLREILRNLPDVTAMREDGTDLLLRLRRGATDISPIAAALVRRGFSIEHFSEEEIDLEEVFLRVTKGIVA